MFTSLELVGAKCQISRVHDNYQIVLLFQLPGWQTESVHCDGDRREGEIENLVSGPRLVVSLLQIYLINDGLVCCSE